MKTCDIPQQNQQQCGTKRFRIVQIHPTLRCNLNCLHCYSSSGPTEKAAINLERLKPALKALSKQGFNAVSISGGEPFMYPQLEELFQYTKKLGYFNMATTNAMLLKTARAKRILQLADLIAVSIDGKPDWHNHLRQSPRAFDKMLEGVEVVKEYVSNFGFIHTVTPESFNDLFWLGEFAVEKGAKLLQLHPLELVGRGKNLADIKLHHRELLKAYIMAFYLEQKHAGQLFVQLDILHKNLIAEKPEAILPIGFNSLSNPKLSDLLKNVVIDEKGKISPFAYGFGDFYKIGHLTPHTDCDKMIEEFISKKGELVQELSHHVFDQIMASEEMDVFNWYEMITKSSLLVNC